VLIHAQQVDQRRHKYHTAANAKQPDEHAYSKSKQQDFKDH
jgi:hypothetical protein